MVKDNEPLAGLRAMVTGAGRGIGAEIARAMAAQGATIACAARTLEEIEAIASNCGGPSFAVTVDVGSEDSVVNAVNTIDARLGGVDILVNCAGVAGAHKFTSLDLAEWRRIMMVDLDGPFLVTRAVLPKMLANKFGRVISIASIYGRIGRPYVSAYAAAKHGVIGLTRALSSEYARSGITFNCVCPGFVRSPMTEITIRDLAARTGRSLSDAEKLLHTPQGRLIQPSEVAAICILLSSSQGASINGQTIVVDGGEVQA